MMKQESVLNVLMYLFKYHLGDDFTWNEGDAELIDQLEDAGFARQTIHKALGWLEQLSEQGSTSTKTTRYAALRVYSDYECAKLTRECRGLITYLENHNILKPHTREMVINQALALQGEGIDTHLIKWVTLLVLFTQPKEKKALASMEFLVLDDPTGLTH